MRTHRLATYFALSASLLAASAGAQVAMGRTFEFRILDPDVADALAWRACGDATQELCRVASSSERSVTVIAEPAVHAAIAAAIAEAEAVPPSQVFQVVLLQAENNGDAGLSRLPAPASRALADAREFLPYSGYTLLGSALLRTDARASSIVNGPDERDYRAELTYRDEVGTHGHRLVVQRFSLDRVASARAANEQAYEYLPVLDTSFSMKPGETVIVGTSKLEGAGRALVVLLTSVE
jgi:hypothetical protein